MRASLLRREVPTFVFAFAALIGTTLALDGLLHAFGVVALGRYLGPAGTLLILLSFGYSLRKRKLVRSGSPVGLLRLHERMAWAGSLLVLVHAGIHFNGLLAWLAVVAMLLTVGSGLVGKFLLGRARVRLEETRARLLAEGLSTAAVEEHLDWDSLTFGFVKQWRKVHYPITLALAVLALGHIVAVIVLGASWRWR
jgi:hypothetical protein